MVILLFNTLIISIINDVILKVGKAFLEKKKSTLPTLSKIFREQLSRIR